MLTSSCLFLNSFSIICKCFYLTLFSLISHQNVISSGQIIMAGLFIILSQNLIHILEHSWCSTNTVLQKRTRVVEHSESIGKSLFLLDPYHSRVKRKPWRLALLSLSDIPNYLSFICYHMNWIKDLLWPLLTYDNVVEKELPHSIHLYNIARAIVLKPSPLKLIRILYNSIRQENINKRYTD